jgi:hypothetical protein
LETELVNYLSGLASNLRPPDCSLPKKLGFKVWAMGAWPGELLSSVFWYSLSNLPLSPSPSAIQVQPDPTLLSFSHQMEPGGVRVVWLWPPPLPDPFEINIFSFYVFVKTCLFIFFCAWLISFNILFSGSIYFVTNDRIFFLMVGICILKSFSLCL